MRALERPPTRRLAPLLGVFALSLTGCDRDDAIVERRAPKGIETIVPEDAPAIRTHEHRRDASAVAGGIEWRLPSGWREAPNDNPTRIAVFVLDDAPDAEVVVTRFPGDVGGVLANVNRWRTQIGLAPVNAESLDAHIERLALHGFDAYLFVASNEGRGVIAAGLEQPTQSRTWFVKATSPEGSIDSIRESVLEFVRSFRAAPESD